MTACPFVIIIICVNKDACNTCLHIMLIVVMFMFNFMALSTSYTLYVTDGLFSTVRVLH